jgi:hypothetical protein
MQGYRAYIIGENGHVENRVDLQCEEGGSQKARQAAR